MSKILDVHAKKAPIESTSAFVEKSYLTAVNGVPGVGQFRSDITNRARIIDPSACLSPSFGVERYPFMAALEVLNEFGASGERVYKMSGDTSDLVRFVGNWDYDNTAAGPGFGSSVVGNYMEIVFYGTGLNILWRNYGGSSFNTVVSIDGGADSANLSPASYSSVLNSRNYHVNAILPVISGLSLGLHTAKFKIAGATSFQINGYEVLNDNSTSVAIQPGYATVGGDRLALTAQALTTYNSGFESGTLGTRGGRVVAYLKKDGTVGKAVQPVDSSAAYLTSTNHVNEELIRVHHVREFGAGRTDDFSSLSASSTNRAFTLEDGTTTLIVQNARLASGGFTIDGVTNNAIGEQFSLTFVGTGLDIYNSRNVSTTDFSLVVDGVSQGAITIAANAHTKLCSGLPYGTHTVKLNRTVAATDCSISKFLVYQPKKPSIPSGAIELADYNIMANYAVGSTTALSAGVLAKSPAKEFAYIGTWSSFSVDVSQVAHGQIATSSASASNYVEYSFFGTGCNLRVLGNSVTSSYTVSVDGSVNLSGFTTAVSGTGVTLTTPSNGVWAFGTINQAGMLSISGMTLGLHKVRVTYTSGNGVNWLGADIVTPIHSPISNKNTIQNALPIGSCSLMDSREFLDSDYESMKASGYSSGVTSGPSTTSTGLVPMPEMSQTIKTNGGDLRISYSVTMENGNANSQGRNAIFLNGIQVSQLKYGTSGAAGTPFTNSDSIRVPVAAGVHKVDVFWVCNGGTLTATTVGRNLLVEEV
jgi:hypothetical protein